MNILQEAVVDKTSTMLLQNLMFSSTHFFNLTLKFSSFSTFLRSGGSLLKHTVALFIKLLSVSSNLDLKADPILTQSD